MGKHRGAVLVTGAASGMGRATAAELDRRGYRIEGADRAAAETGFPLAAVDVRDDDAVRQWVGEVCARHETISGVVTFAGYGLKGAVEETESEEAAALLDTNVIGTARVVRAVLPRLRAQGHGRVIVVSSGAAAVAHPFAGWYSASKAAIERLGEALRLEVAASGVQVSVLAPGWTRTPILSTSPAVANPLAEVYGDASRQVNGRMDEYLAQGQSPEDIAGAVARILSARRTRPVYRVGKDVRTAYAVRRIVPSRLYERLVRDHFGLS